MITEYLNALKDKKNLSWKDISDLSGVPVPTLRNIFSGETQNPGIQPVAAIITAMGGSLDEMMGNGSPTPKSHDVSQLEALYKERIDCIKTEHREAMDTITRFYDQRIAESEQREERTHRRQQRMLYFILSITGCLILSVLILAIDLLQGGALI